MSNNKKQQFNIIGKTNKSNTNEDINIKYNAKFWTNESNNNYAYTNVHNSLWNENNGLDGSSNIKSGITQFVHAVTIDWDNPSTTDIPSLYMLNDNQSIESTDDIFYVLENIAKHFVNYKKPELSINWNNNQNKIGTYNLSGLINGKITDECETIKWSCSNKYAKLSSNIGSGISLSIDFKQMIEDHVKLRETSKWILNNNTSNEYTKKFEAYWDSDFYPNSSEEGLVFKVTASHNSTDISKTVTINYDINKINIVGGQWIIDNLKSDDNQRVKILNKTNATCTLSQKSYPTNIVSHVLYLSPKLSNQYLQELTVDDNQNYTPSNLLALPKITFNEYFTNINDIYITTISESEYNTELVNNIKENIFELLNVKLNNTWDTNEEVYNINYNTVKNILSENLFNKDYLVICYPNSAFYLYDSGFSQSNQIILNESFETSSTALYFKNFTLKIYNSQSKNNYIRYLDNIKNCCIIDNYKNQYFTIRTGNKSDTIKFSILNENFNSNYVNLLEYSTDNGRTWKGYNTHYNSYLIISTPTINKNQTVLFRANAIKFADVRYNESKQDYEIINSAFFNSYNYSFNVSGNIMSLIYLNDFRGKTSFKSTNNQQAEYVFTNLFNNTRVKHANNLILPVTKLSRGCYARMFYSCIYLRKIPSLFSNINNVSNFLPELAESCFEEMYYGCYGLTSIDVNYLQYVKDLKFKSCSEMFSKCTKLTNIPYLKYINTVDKYCCENMFRQCKSIENIDDNDNYKLNPTSLKEGCYGSMFYGCENLKSVNKNIINNASILGNWCYANMFYNCAITNPPSININATLAEHCFENMFELCKLLTYAPKLSLSDSLPKSCYQNMFLNCTSIQYNSNNSNSLTELPATKLSEKCYYGMFEGCTSLTTAPKLANATIFGEQCYANMFKNCKNLSKIILLVEDLQNWTTWDLFENWVSGVSNSGTFVRSINIKWKEYDKDYINQNYSYIVPINWILNNNNEGLGLDEYIDENISQKLNNAFYIENTQTTSGTLYIKVGPQSNLKNNITKLKYQINNGSLTTISSITNNKAIITVPGNAKIKFTVTSDIESLNSKFTNSSNTWCSFYSNFKYKIGGNIMSLLYKNFNTLDNNVKDYALMRLFSDSSNGKNTTNNNKTNLIGINNDFIMPAKKIGVYGYEYMFEGCENMSDNGSGLAFPLILAKTISARSMQKMFYNCKKIYNPKLYVSYINNMYNDGLQFNDTNQSCFQMFANCINISTDISLYTNTAQRDSYKGMFNGAINNSSKYNIFLYNKYDNNSYTSNNTNNTNYDYNYYIGITSNNNNESWISNPQQNTYQYIYYYYETNNYNIYTGNWIKQQIINVEN